MSKIKSSKEFQKKLKELIESVGLDELLRAVTQIDNNRRVWKPGCNIERVYTYHHVEEVDNCPLNDNQEATIEATARQRAEDKVKRLCQRNDKCKKLIIVDSWPSGGGCNCGNVPIVGRKCVYTCTWSVKYKCERKSL